MNSNGNEWWKNVSDKGQSAKANVSGFFKKIKMFILPAIIVVILAILALTSVYTVNDKQQAVVTTFGKVTSI